MNIYFLTVYSFAYLIMHEVKAFKRHKEEGYNFLVSLSPT